MKKFLFGFLFSLIAISIFAWSRTNEPSTLPGDVYAPCTVTVGVGGGASIQMAEYAGGTKYKVQIMQGQNAVYVDSSATAGTFAFNFTVCTDYSVHASVFVNGNWKPSPNATDITAAVPGVKYVGGKKYIAATGELLCIEGTTLGGLKFVRCSDKSVFYSCAAPATSPGGKKK